MLWTLVIRYAEFVCWAINLSSLALLLTVTNLVRSLPVAHKARYMADVQPRPSHRTSRGGFHSSRGRSSHSARTSRSAVPESSSADVAQDYTTSTEMSTLDDSAKQLKSQFASALGSLSELFPEWSEEDLLYLLQETQGDVEVAVVRITEGKFFLCNCAIILHPEQSISRSSADHCVCNQSFSIQQYN